VEHLNKAAVVAQRHQLQRREKARPKVGRMRSQPEAELVGQRGHPQIFGDAADLGDGRLGVTDGACGHHLPELMRRAGVFSRSDIEPAVLAHLGQRREILWRPDRLFQKHRPGFPAFMGKCGRGRAIHRAVQIDHQRDISADRLPRGKNRRRGRLVQLDRGVAPPQRGLAFARDRFRRADPEQARIGRNPRALSFADQPMQRDALCLCREIPHRDVEPGNRKHRDAVAAEQMQIALDAFHEGRNTRGVRYALAPRLRCNHLVDRFASGLRADIAKGIAPAGET